MLFLDLLQFRLSTCELTLYRAGSQIFDENRLCLACLDSFDSRFAETTIHFLSIRELETIVLNFVLLYTIKYSPESIVYAKYPRNSLQTQTSLFALGAYNPVETDPPKTYKAPCTHSNLHSQASFPAKPSRSQKHKAKKISVLHNMLNTYLHLKTRQRHNPVFAYSYSGRST